MNEKEHLRERLQFDCSSSECSSPQGAVFVDVNPENARYVVEDGIESIQVKCTQCGSPYTFRLSEYLSYIRTAFPVTHEELCDQPVEAKIISMDEHRASPPLRSS